MSANTCAKCNTPFDLSQKFCTYCGTPVAGAKVRCGRCGGTMEGDANFCPICGSRSDDIRKATVSDNRWARRPEDFATRVRPSDLPGLLRKGITVEEGTRALLFLDGAFSATLPAGRYDLANFRGRMPNVEGAKRADVLLVEAGEVTLSFDVADILTSDPVRVGVDGRLILEVEEAGLFLTNVVKGRTNYGLHDMQALVYEEVREGLQEFVGTRSVRDLASDLSLKREVEVSLAGHLSETLRRCGLSLVQLRTLNWRLGRYEKLREIREEVFLQVGEREAELEGRKRLFDVLREEDLQELVEETRRVERFEKRAELWARMRRAVASDRMDEVRDEDRLEAFLQEVDRDKLLRKEEMDELKRAFLEKGEDHELARQRMLEKLEVEHGLEQERIRLMGREHMETDLLEARLDRRRTELERDLEDRRIREAARREEEIKDRRNELDLELARARADVEKARSEVERKRAGAEIAGIEREQDRLDTELGLASLEKMKAVKRNDERERMLMEMEQKEREAELRIREKEAAGRVETERLKALSQLSMEAVISASGPEQAALIAELKKTEILKGMSEEQILALAAERSPHVAQAFQEKYRALSSEKGRELYERMIADKDRTSGEQARIMQEMFNKALETQKDTARAFADGGRPQVLSPWGAGPGEARGQAGGDKVMLCSRCRLEVEPGNKFCKNCGNQMF